MGSRLFQNVSVKKTATTLSEIRGWVVRENQQHHYRWIGEGRVGKVEVTSPLMIMKSEYYKGVLPWNESERVIDQFGWNPQSI